PISARPPAGRRMRMRRGPKRGDCSLPPPSPGPRVPSSTSAAEAGSLSLDATSRRSGAGNLSRDNSDVPGISARPPAGGRPPRVTDFPVVEGSIRSAKGYLGAFELIVDGYAQPAPSSRGTLSFAAPRDGAVSRCDLVLDISGGAALFTASDLRDGYLRADPG